MHGDVNQIDGGAVVNTKAKDESCCAALLCSDDNLRNACFKIELVHDIAAGLSYRNWLD